MKFKTQFEYRGNGFFLVSGFTNPKFCTYKYSLKYMALNNIRYHMISKVYLYLLT